MCLCVCLSAAVAQLTDKIDHMYIIPKDRPLPGDDACVICFSSVSNFGQQGPQKLFFFALVQLTDKMDPIYIIPKVLSEPHNDVHVI